MQKYDYTQLMDVPDPADLPWQDNFMTRSDAVCHHYLLGSHTDPSSHSGVVPAGNSLRSKLLTNIKNSRGLGSDLYGMCSRLYWSYKIRNTRNRSDAEHIRREFRKGMGYPLDLANPRTFSEKLQYLKLHDQTSLHQMCADKIAVRDYVRQALSNDVLVPLIMTTYDVEDICPEKISEHRFVAKTNHDSGSIQFCHDRERFNWRKCRRLLGHSLKTEFWLVGRELQYRNIKKGIIVESMLSSDEHNLRDYKFYCFDGEPIFLQVDINRFDDHRRDLFDMQWNKLNVQYHLPNSDSVIRRPETLDSMIEYVRILSKPFKFSRIDLYSIEKKVYFGEITFHPYSGFKGFTPHSFDRDLGDLIHL